MSPMCRTPLGRESWITPNEVPEKATRENEMFEYEIATARRADLIREADRYRAVREAKKASRTSRSQESERTVSRHRGLFTRAA